jgi:hypothetical protein
VFLFLGAPRDHAITKGEAVAADGVASVMAVGVVRVCITDKRDRGGTAESE